LCGGYFRKWVNSGIHNIRNLRPRDFECLVAECLAQHGLHDASLTPITADGGVDIVAAKVCAGKELKYIIQCKRFSVSNKVGVEYVRELVGTKSITGAKHALLITTSEFTSGAKEIYQKGRMEPWGIRLLDYKSLLELLRKS
jgi:HJR/Mrr/RecB family endonuclease